MDIYLLGHVHEFDDGHEDTKIIGIFSTRERAEAALDRVRSQPGFRDHPEGFDISEYRLDDEDLAWSEGYDTVRAGEYLPDDKSYREYFAGLAGVGDDIYTECCLCGSACPTTGGPDHWQCSCGNLSIDPARRTAKAGDKTIRVFRLKSNRE